MFAKLSYKRSAMLGIAALAAFTITAPQAHAGFIATVQQVGSDVVITGSGTLNTNALVLLSGTGTSTIPAINPSNGTLNLSGGLDQLFGTIVGPASFGSGGLLVASSFTGDAAGTNAFFGRSIIVPLGYVSGAALSDSDTFNSTTIAGLGITPGTYVWTWGTGQNADFFEITTNAPEPASILLVGSAMLALLTLRRRIAR